MYVYVCMYVHVHVCIYVCVCVCVCVCVYMFLYIWIKPPSFFLLDEDGDVFLCVRRRHYLETDPDPIAMVIRVELFTHKPSQTNTNWHCMVTHARLCYRRLLSTGLVDD